MTYNNPLHPPIKNVQCSPFSALGSAVTNNSAHSGFISPQRRRLPQATYTPNSKWRSATGRLNQVYAPIIFDYIGYTRQGVPMQELGSRSTYALAHMITGANDLVFAHTGLQRFTLRIMWPGYSHIEWARSIEVNANGPMTRAQLGGILAMNFARFLEKIRGEVTTAPEWRISSNGIRFDHVVLVGLHNVFEDVWQADVAIDLR
ncbi:hypothetical protein BDQ12DRAFT_658156 [Crucibulum laeve]|uniref:Uncharacterized protein n=1 Tax=Crucibulum laeve TaxID=68775 RepID=A0A5C3LKJ5_9AGAR|nr:hypothetical protein BDQ12DRAFT_658156 [Crucibulum laeve]